MAQHFLLSRVARNLSLRQILFMGRLIGLPDLPAVFRAS